MFHKNSSLSIENDLNAIQYSTYPVIHSLLNALEARLPLIRYHSEAVAILAVNLGKEFGWKGKDLELLEVAALLHDVGKIAIPDVILRKTEALCPSEWDIIKLHPDYSIKIIEPIVIFKQIIPWVYHHHENWDGTGYPSGLKGDNIPIASRIISIADSFQAITTERIYKKAFSAEKGLTEIERCSGKQFDPEIAKIFSEMIKLSISSGKGC